MPKLPPELVKKPGFDSPFRSTTSAAAPAPAPDVVAPPPKEESAMVGPVVAIAPVAEIAERKSTERAAPRKADASESELTRKFTLRLTDDQWRALHSECHRRRMENGESLSAGELAREILADWMKRSARRAATS